MRVSRRDQDVGCFHVALPSPSTLQREHSSAFTARAQIKSSLGAFLNSIIPILITEEGCRYKDPLSAFRCL